MILQICAIFTYTELIGTPNMLWLLATVGIRLRKWTCGEGGPKMRVCRSRASSCSVVILDCLLSGSTLMAGVGDCDRSQDEGMDG